MAVPSAILKEKYQGNNVQVDWDYRFKIFNKNQILAKKIVGLTETLLIVDVDFSVSGVGNDAGGKIKYPLSGAPLGTGEYILIKPNFEYKQGTELLNQTSYDADTIEAALDDLSMQIKQVAETAARAVALTDAYEDTPEELLDLLLNAADVVGDVSADVAAAQAAATAAGVSAAAAAAAAAGVSLPPAAVPDALKVLRLNAAGTAYELFTASTGGTGTLKDMNIGQGLENDGAANLRIKLNGSTIDRSASGLKVADAGITDTQLNTTGVAAGTYLAANVTVNTKGRVTGISAGSVGLTSVSQGNMNTTTGTVSGTAQNGYSVSTVTLPAGQYGFFPQTSVSFVYSDTANGFLLAGDTTGYNTSVRPYSYYYGGGGPPVVTVRAQQRYVTSSPPYDMGDGEVAGFLYVLVDGTGKVVSHYFADDPPWAYNGPTYTWADYYDPETKKKYRLKNKSQDPKQKLRDILEGKPVDVSVDTRDFDSKLKEALYLEKVNAFKDVGKVSREELERDFVNNIIPRVKAKILKEQYEPITHDIKNADIDLIPHPFGTVPDGHHVILIDCYESKIRDFMALQNQGAAEDVIEVILDYLDIQTDFIEGLKCPKGVHHAKLRIK